MAYTANGRQKSFPVFDCDSHIYEPPEIWDKYIPQNQQEFAKTHFYRDADRLILVRNTKISFRNPDQWKYPGETWHPGLTKKIIGDTQPGTKEWDETIGRNKSARDPHARLKDMDAAGIDQVMIFPSTFVYLPLVENADAAYICARAYNDWAHDYCSADKKGCIRRRFCRCKASTAPLKNFGAWPNAVSNPLWFGRSSPRASIRHFPSSI